MPKRVFSANRITIALAIENHWISRDEYLEGELTSEIRHEYVAGSFYVLSGGTLNHQRIDEIQKFRDYITIPALLTYILAETDAPFLTLHRRDSAGFRRKILSGPNAVLELPEAGITIALAELYQDVD